MQIKSSIYRWEGAAALNSPSAFRRRCLKRSMVDGVERASREPGS
ncbi:MAG: hypothetical protein RMI45_06375 [Ignisphaera sp.]|nr:hypothetical protein [Ignisphaera sp.]MDW8085849.1 hypothetical protein [Ignisphaera sp.]